MDRQIAIRLQVFHRLLSCLEGGNLTFKVRHLLDLRFQLGDFRFQERVALLLVGDHLLVPEVDGAGNKCTCQQGQHQRNVEHLARPLARHLAVGE